MFIFKMYTVQSNNNESLIFSSEILDAITLKIYPITLMKPWISERVKYILYEGLITYYMEHDILYFIRELFYGPM